MQSIDSVKLGLLGIVIICVVIGVVGLIYGPPDKKTEIALAALAGASVIGGWLGHAQTVPPTPDTGKEPVPIAKAKIAADKPTTLADLAAKVMPSTVPPPGGDIPVAGAASTFTIGSGPTS